MATPDPQAEELSTIEALVRVLDSTVFLSTIWWVLGFTVLIACIELIAKTSTSGKAILNISTLLYVGILFLGNLLASALFLIPFVEIITAKGNSQSYAPLAAFVGVFSFEGVLSNVNITFFNKGILTIADWISKARDAAIADSVATDVQETVRTETQTAERLAKLPIDKLNTHITHVFGAGAVAKLDAEAKADDSDPALYKALKLVSKDLKRAKGLLA